MLSINRLTLICVVLDLPLLPIFPFIIDFEEIEALVIYIIAYLFILLFILFIYNRRVLSELKMNPLKKAAETICGRNSACVSRLWIPLGTAQKWNFAN